ncbi:MAG: hypothetical protein RIT45_2118 [Pseudomonadota bacterium]
MPAPVLAGHPGSVAHPAEVRAAVAAAVAALPADYRPRTRHVLAADGRSAALAADAGKRHADPYAPAGSRPRFTNRLLLEPSPYLRQHAHNPVDWRPWGVEAFEEARRLGRPIFLSVGYATCHWCHVMEHESFEDLEIAALLNSRYVPVKVDREERPDVDAIYMAAVQALSGGGGWPMSVWIAPGEQGLGGLPFFAGTYFPPRAGARRGRPGFLDLLTRFADRYAGDPASVQADGERVAAHIRQQLERGAAGSVPRIDVVQRLAAEVQTNVDPRWGGFRRAPKFPSHVPISLLLRQGEGVQAALLTLERMCLGGIYDHAGGGFARYSTDERWLVPHFEKMLYDQALIGRALVDAVRWLDRDGASDAERLRGRRFARVLRHTLDYLLREMQAPAGGFYSATDADSEGEEGRFFLWTPAELRAVLGPEDADWLAARYDVRPGGNFEGRSILHLDAWLPEAEQARADALLERLRLARAERVPPLLDDKVLASWNGLLIETLARASEVLQAPRYLEAAQRAARFVTVQMRDAQGRQLRVAIGEPAAGGSARVAGQLDDHAFVAAGLLALFEATGEPSWLREARSLQARLDSAFWDARGHGYFATAADAPSLLAREKPDYDGAEPSGNAVAAQNLLRLGALTGEQGYHDRGVQTVAAFGARLARMPLSMADLLLAVQMLHAPLREVVLVRPAQSTPAAFEPMLRALRRAGLPQHVRLLVQEGEAQRQIAAVAPIVAEKVARGGTVTAYVCVRGTCKLPTTEPEVMIRQLRDGPR